MLNRSAIYSMSSILFKMMSGPLALILIATDLTKIEQGVYFTFISLSAIQWVFELGITTCIVQFLSASRYKRKKYYISFLIYFMLFSVIFLQLSFVIISRFVFENIESDIWFFPWLFYSIFVCLNMFAGSFLVIEEGCGNVERAYGIKFISSMSYTVFLIASLFFGLKLFSLVLAQLAMLLPVIIILRSRFFVITSVFSIKAKRLRVVLREVISFQSKLSIVWIVGYFYWNSFSIIFFRCVSPEYAGEFGAINSVFSSISAISVALISTKRVPWGELNFLGHVVESYNDFKLYSVISVVIFLAPSILFVLFVQFFPELDISKRFLPLEEIMAFAFLRLLILLQELSLQYLRTFKDEPLYVITCVNYLTMPVVVFLSLSMPSLIYVYIIVSVVQLFFVVYYFLFLHSYVKARLRNV
ncbi:hypothetical protein ACSTDZ_06105 [Vibrio vulnificus]|uniref:hypothetical protein n=1 Tax=Vibrio vulnificus TaxID=672 RepID=UPI003ED9F312